MDEETFTIMFTKCIKKLEGTLHTLGPPNIVIPAMICIILHHIDSEEAFESTIQDMHETWRKIKAMRGN